MKCLFVTIALFGLSLADPHKVVKKLEKRGLEFGHHGGFEDNSFESHGHDFGGDEHSFGEELNTGHHHDSHIKEHYIKAYTVTKKVPVPHPYPVHVEVKKPYPVPVKVPVKVPVDKPYPVFVPKPYPVTVEKPYPVTVEKKVPFPVKVPIKVPVKVPYPVEVPKPYHVTVYKKYPVPVPHPIFVEKKVPIHIKEHHHEHSFDDFSSFDGHH